MSILIVAPHPDDETLGAGGTILRAIEMGIDVHWLILTEMREELGFTAAQIEQRKNEIKSASETYGFASTTTLGLPASQLDTIALGDIISSIGDTIRETEPNTIYLPFPGDIHSDHRIAFDAGSACTKSFRYPYVKKVIAMEILSETNFGVDPTKQSFVPNQFIDITEHLDKKIQIMKIFDGEMRAPPFPRSERAIRSLAYLRGSQAGVNAAEAFHILREIC